MWPSAVPGRLCLLAVFYCAEAPPEVRMFSCQISPKHNTPEGFKENKHLTLKKCFLWQKSGLQRNHGEQICPLLTGPLWACAQEPAGHLLTLSAAQLPG